MKKKFRNVALAAALGAGIVGATAFSSQASASSLETTVVEIAETNVVNGGNKVQPRNLAKAWVYGTEAVKFWAPKVADMFISNGGMAYSVKNEVTKDAEIIFDK